MPVNYQTMKMINKSNEDHKDKVAQTHGFKNHAHYEELREASQKRMERIDPHNKKEHQLPYWDKKD